MLTNENYEIIRTFIYDNKVKIAQYFSNAKEAAIMYFSAAIGNAQKVCIADLAGEELYLSLCASLSINMSVHCVT